MASAIKYRDAPERVCTKNAIRVNKNRTRRDCFFPRALQFESLINQVSFLSADVLNCDELQII